MKRTHFICITIITTSVILLLNVKNSLYSSNCLDDEERSSLSFSQPSKFSTQIDINETTKATTVMLQLQNPKLIIILASIGRSGSTMIAELMNTKEKTVLFFEPDHLTEHSACARVSECMSEYLKNTMLCNYDGNFEQWLKSKYVFLEYFHPVIKQCNKNHKCEKKISLLPLCQDSEYRLAKTIRVRLGFLESLLKDEIIDLKIVYLVRDLRASANSIKRLKWNDAPNVICPQVYDDLLAFDYLTSKYPQKLFKIQYEHFSLYPFNQSAQLFNFAYGDKDLPVAAANYLQKHTRTAEDGPMNTIRDSKSHYQQWRWEISEKTLKSLEKEPSCIKALEKLKYNLFGNLSRARNKNISLFVS